MVTEVKQSRFREDLYYRLNVFPLQTKNLKDRKDDIFPIALKILEKHCKEKQIPIISSEAQEVIINHDWPGNVRELRNLIERIAILSPGENQDKIINIIKESLSRSLDENFSVTDTLSVPLREARETFEKEYLISQIKKFGGNISKTARFVGMERSALHRKLKILGVKDLN